MPHVVQPGRETVASGRTLAAASLALSGFGMSNEPKVLEAGATLCIGASWTVREEDDRGRPHAEFRDETPDKKTIGASA